MTRLFFVAGAAGILGACGAARHPVLLAVGDIAVCERQYDEATAALADSLRRRHDRDGRPVVIVTMGDNVYPRGTSEQYARCHAPSWGRAPLMAITRPAPGNHDYLLDRTAGPYFAYFGERAGPPGLGYYGFWAGEWRVLSLNSELSGEAMAAQQAWVREELARHRNARCVLAYWHKPVWSSGAHGPNPVMAPIWRLLDSAEADLILTGHDHTYERFSPMDADGRLVPGGGVQQFVAGTGGAGPYEFTHAGRAPNSAFRHTGDYGVLALELLPGRYRFEFVTVDGRVLDRGEERCR